MSKAIFFDRDGTLNIDVNFLRRIEDLKYFDGVFEGMKALKVAGFKFFVVTNQSGIARGIITHDELEAIHKQMKADFAKHDLFFEDIYSCNSMPESGDPDRKPAPGMLLRGIEKLGLDPKLCWMVGDKPIDIEAGARAGVTTIHFRHHPTEDIDWPARPSFVATSFSQVVSIILTQTK